MLLSWRVQHLVVIGRICYEQEHCKISLNFEFDRNIVERAPGWLWLVGNSVSCWRQGLFCDRDWMQSNNIIIFFFFAKMPHFIMLLGTTNIGFNKRQLRNYSVKHYIKQSRNQSIRNTKCLPGRGNSDFGSSFIVCPFWLIKHNFH